jgi:hypothetical protein
MMSPIIQNAACILTVSEFTRGRLCELLKVDPGRVAVIGNGIDPLYFAAPGCAEAPSPETDPAQIGLGGRPYVVVVGGLTRRKGGDLVLQVAQILQREQPEMRILVAGKGEPAFSAPASDLGNVVLLQHVPTIQLVKLLRGAMAAVMLSRYEGFGIPVVEAMADCSWIPRTWREPPRRSDGCRRMTGRATVMCLGARPAPRASDGSVASSAWCKHWKAAEGGTHRRPSLRAAFYAFRSSPVRGASQPRESSSSHRDFGRAFLVSRDRDGVPSRVYPFSPAAYSNW